jgi:hypothetical protein
MRGFAISAATDAIAALANFFLVAMTDGVTKRHAPLTIMSVQFCTLYADTQHGTPAIAYCRQCFGGRWMRSRTLESEMSRVWEDYFWPFLLSIR